MLGQLGLVPEIENPKEYGTIVKNSITILVAAAGAAAPMASTILFRELKLFFVHAFRFAITLRNTNNGSNQ